MAQITADELEFILNEGCNELFFTYKGKSLDILFEKFGSGYVVIYGGEDEGCTLCRSTEEVMNYMLDGHTVREVCEEFEYA